VLCSKNHCDKGIKKARIPNPGFFKTIFTNLSDHTELRRMAVFGESGHEPGTVIDLFDLPRRK